MKNILLTVLVAVLASLGVFTLLNKKQEAAHKQETAYERVMRTKTLRCGYAIWPPYVFTKDAKTGKLGGIMYDITEETAKQLQLKVEWSEETGWGNWIEGLKGNRFDAFCPGVFANAARGKYTEFTSPLFFNAIDMYVRSDDHRFDADMKKLNDAQYQISAQDGEASEFVARRHFPKAKVLSMPQLSDINGVLWNVKTGKADAAFNEPSFVNGFLAKNPNSLRKVNDKPLEVYPTSMAVYMGEYELRDMLNSAIIEMLNNGTIDKIIDRYEPNRSVMLRVAKPYEH